STRRSTTRMWGRPRWTGSRTSGSSTAGRTGHGCSRAWSWRRRTRTRPCRWSAPRGGTPPSPGGSAAGWRATSSGTRSNRCSTGSDDLGEEWTRPSSSNWSRAARAARSSSSSTWAGSRPGRTSAAFANTDGGTILFGVDDDGSLRGLTDAQVEKIGETLEKLAGSCCRSTCGPSGWTSTASRSWWRGCRRPGRRRAAADGQWRTWCGTRRAAASRRRRDLGRRAGATAARQAQAVRRHGVQVRGGAALVDYYWAIDRAVKATGLPVELVRMDLEEGDYEITAEIINRIRESDIVLADFTLGSENVYFEAGVAVGAQKRLIRTARRTRSCRSTCGRGRSCSTRTRPNWSRSCSRGRGRVPEVVAGRGGAVLGEDLQPQRQAHRTASITGAHSGPRWRSDR
ncbi:ATP-binding protein, partial [Saccharothrix sp. MB29]|nr:ATP-binding protein [Saccharothrix sp. MB29]